jgi:hypothetical protein
MSPESRFRLLGGIILIIFGGFLMVARLFPEIAAWELYFQGWPITIIATGFVLFVLGLVSNSPGMTVPACLVSGIGGILLYQNNTGNWNSWSFAWALIPGFVGFGVLLAGLLEGRLRSEASGGLWLIFISAVLFISFGAFLGNISEFKNFWPVVLIFLGLWILVKSIIRRE